MSRYSTSLNISDFDALKLAVASPSDIYDWSHGEVLKPETINYRTQKPERDGLFCERIFGPVKDINPHDAKYKGVRSREAAVDKKGEIVTKSIVRRERLGHITLASPVAHIWFLRGTPSAVGLLLGMTVKNLERVVYFASYVITEADTEALTKIREDKEAQHDAEKNAIKSRYEAEASEEGADVKVLATKQTKELEDLALQYEKDIKTLELLNERSLISEVEYRQLDDEIKGAIKVGMGAASIKELLDRIDIDELIEELAAEVEDTKGQRRKKAMKRLRLCEGIKKAGIAPGNMCITVLPVIPPDLRPMVQLTGGRFATSDLNDLYRRVINRNNRLKKLIDLNAPEVIRRNEQRMLQEAVDALIDNNSTRSGRAIAATGQRRRLKSLSDMLKGKQGRFRQNLLGKRVDYSGRSVIVAGPELSIDECGLPKMMALELFKPFVIGKLIRDEYAHNIRSATRMIEQGETAVWDALDEVIDGKYVLLNRAPSLHRLSIQAFRPILIEGKAIQLHPLVCKGFNADFDGDQMAVHLPLSQEAQAEARDIMASNKNLLKPADGSPILHIEQDIVLGCYYLTYEKPGVEDSKMNFTGVAEALMAYDNKSIVLQSPITIVFRGKRLNTTLGRVLFNEVFPEDFPYQDKPMTKKKLASVMSLVYQKYGQDRTAVIADKLKDIGFYHATSAALSIGMSDFNSVVGIREMIEERREMAAKISEQYAQGFLTNQERYRLTVDNWQDFESKVQSVLTEQFEKENSSMSISVLSGARGNIGQVKTIVGVYGVAMDATGRPIELPILSNYKIGLTPLEYFTATRGARKGMIDTALKTADSGYLTRRLVDVSQDVFTVDSEERDLGLEIGREETEQVGVPFSSRLEGRYAAEDVGDYVSRGDLINEQIANAIDSDKNIKAVKIMSVLSSTDPRGIPRKSYGIDPATGELVPANHPIGVIAAQSIGEPGTQLTLRTFHSGGVAGSDITTGLPRVEELFEARNPKGQAFISETSGTVDIQAEENINKVRVIPAEAPDHKIKLEDNQKATVENKAEVVAGDVIAADETKKSVVTAPVSGTIKIGKDSLTIKPDVRGIVTYEIPTQKQLSVKTGEIVTVGDRLTYGSINLHELLRLKGVEPVQSYIINEVLGIFASQGQNISEKHLEVIVRQMFARVQIEDAGDSSFVTGDTVNKYEVLDANEKLEAEGKAPVKYNQLLLGITKASLSTESFLSAASFQDTTRVLIAAAISGKVDKLRGLKENVILGRKIPVGTGITKTEDIEKDEEF
jgi:DNA-directed RNA polymerase subunit beta'